MVDSNFDETLDPELRRAALLCFEHQSGSPSLLQRYLKIGYMRARRIVSKLEEFEILKMDIDGIKAPTVIVKTKMDLEIILAKKSV